MWRWLIVESAGTILGGKDASVCAVAAMPHAMVTIMATTKTRIYNFPMSVISLDINIGRSSLLGAESTVLVAKDMGLWSVVKHIYIFRLHFITRRITLRWN